MSPQETGDIFLRGVSIVQTVLNTNLKLDSSTIIEYNDLMTQLLLPPNSQTSMYLGEYETWYSPSSKLYRKVLDNTAKSFFYGRGVPPNSTPNFKTAWLSFVRDQGVRIYRKQDWNTFWRRVHMIVIMYCVEHMGNEELIPPYDIFGTSIKRLIATMPEDKPVLSRGQFFGSHITYEDLYRMRNILQALLVYTSEASDQAKKDYPGWFQETDNLVGALFNGMNLRPEKEKKYFFTSSGVGNVHDIDVRPYGLDDGDGVMINDVFYSLDDAKKLAYTILESVRYVEEQPHVKETQHAIESKPKSKQ